MKLGEKLIKQGIISEDELQIALTEQNINPGKMGEILVRLGFVEEKVARKIIGDVAGYSSMSLEGVIPSPNALELISESVAKSNTIIPLSFTENTITIAIPWGNPEQTIQKIRRFINSTVAVIKPVLVGEQDIINAIDKFYGYALSINGILKEIETGEVDLEEFSQEEKKHSHPIVRLVNALLTDAVKSDASDVHFEPEEHFVRIRYRIDGVLKNIKLIHETIYPAMVVRLKVLSELDLTDQRKPQDGRMDLSINGRKISFRVSTLPGVHGENFVFRVLDKDKGIVPLDNLGLDTESYRELRIMMARPTGMLLITGPTGSGKTTTLYSMLNEMNEMKVNIMTLEDPVEYPMPLIRQTEINEDVGLTFGLGIKALLRQDPDIILIGEIRDAETASMGIKAAMTGHQVFSTLHTNSALGALPRLLDLGVSRSIMSGSIIGIVAQRLARKLCKCKKSYLASQVEKKLLNLPLDKECTLYKKVGCDACEQSGYKGRLAVLEILRFTDELDELVLNGASQVEIMKAAISQGFSTMTNSALRWVVKGESTMEEVGRVVDLTELVH